MLKNTLVTVVALASISASGRNSVVDENERVSSPASYVIVGSLLFVSIPVLLLVFHFLSQKYVELLGTTLIIFLFFFGFKFLSYIQLIVRDQDGAVELRVSDLNARYGLSNNRALAYMLAILLTCIAFGLVGTVIVSFVAGQPMF